jgi:hypothetical protein
MESTSNSLKNRRETKTYYLEGISANTWTLGGHHPCQPEAIDDFQTTMIEQKSTQFQAAI